MRVRSVDGRWRLEAVASRDLSVWCFGFRDSGFGYQIPGLGVWGFRLRDSGFGFQIPKFGFRVAGLGFRGSGIGYQV